MLDTNVGLDLFLDRTPFAYDAAALCLAYEQKRIAAYVAAITPINLFYIACKLRDERTARRAVVELVAALHVCPIDQGMLNSALSLPFPDYEDAVQHAAASSAGLEAIITRNEKDYSAATLPVFSLREFVQRYLPTLE